MLKLVLVPVLDNYGIFKMVLVPVLNHFRILKLVLVPVLNHFRILKLVLVPIRIFSYSQTGTGTSYLYHLKFKGVIGLEILILLLQYGLYLNIIVYPGILV